MNAIGRMAVADRNAIEADAKIPVWCDREPAEFCFPRTFGDNSIIYRDVEDLDRCAADATEVQLNV